MNSKVIVFFAVIVVAIGVFALPYSVLHMSGDLNEGIPKVANMSSMSTMSEDIGSTHSVLMGEIIVSGAHLKFSCDTCHHSPIGNFEFHVECMDCHGDTGNIYGHWSYTECQNCSICHLIGGISSYTDFISAGGFGMNTTPFDIGQMAAHEALIRAAEDNPLMAGANEACVACHTGVNVTDVNVNIEIEKEEYMTFDVGRGEVTFNDPE
ncbi:hypothetical protein C5S53_07870 [Methanophagales archaeon]|jgi:hypothetical protein|nr:hypothetical protein C5S53_07870 [Methanophagales archaeon]